MLIVGFHTTICYSKFMKRFKEDGSKIFALLLVLKLLAFSDVFEALLVKSTLF